MRQYTGIDKLINSFDQALRSLVPGATSAQRSNPSEAVVPCSGKISTSCTKVLRSGTNMALANGRQFCFP